MRWRSISLALLSACLALNGSANEWEFVSTHDAVAAVAGSLRAPETKGAVRITGIVAGCASVSTIGSSAWTPVTIRGICGAESPVRVETPVTVARARSEVSLRALAHANARTLFR